MQRQVRIVIVDDHEVVRRGLISLLGSNPGYRVIGEAEDGDTAMRLARELRPDVLITDLVHPRPDGMELTRWIKREVPEVRVLILSMYANEQDFRKMKEAGARGFVMKSDAVRALIKAIDTIMEGKQFFFRSIAEVLRAGFVETPPPAPTSPLLTKRQIKIVSLLARGRSNQEIAKEMKVKISTATAYRTAIIEKLQVHSIQDVVRYAVKNRLIEL